MGVSFVLRRQLHERLPRARFVLLLATAVLISLFYNAPALSQSTFGTIVGTVKDASGDVVNGASVVLTTQGRRPSARWQPTRTVSFLSST